MFRLYIQFRILLWVLWDNVINSDCGLLGEDIMYFCRWLPTSVQEEFLLHVWMQHVWSIGDHLWNKAKENLLEIISYLTALFDHGFLIKVYIRGWNVCSSVSCASVFWESKLAYELWHLQWCIKHWHIVIWEVIVWH